MLVLRLSTLLSLLIFLSACASTTELPELDYVSTEAAMTLLHKERKFGLAKTSLKLPDDNIFGITPEMRYFVNEHVPAVLTPKARLRYLNDALISPNTLGIAYNPGLTLTASEAFSQREGNCLSLTALFVSLAKEAKLDAYFNEVTIPPSWEMLSENSSATYRHINAVAELENERQQVVDFSVDIYDYRYPQKRISEEIVAAQYYSNIGIGHLNSGDYAAAYLYLRRAVYLAPEQAYLWGNLGVLFRREGHINEAETAFSYALQLNPEETPAMNNLARLFREGGRKREAKALEKVARQRQRKNPFLHYSHARDAYERGEFLDALSSIHTAIRLDGDEHRFLLFAAVIYRRLGNTEKYEEFGRRAAQAKLREN